MAGKTVTACMLIIGNEILSGRTQDINLNFLAKSLNELGVRMTEARVIPDIEDTIVATVNECRTKFDHVFTTGGIGPTHDDITAVCIAKAFDTEVIYHPEIEARIRKR
jgi:molybdenum cofactor synthesis domain-containing protein